MATFNSMQGMPTGTSPNDTMMDQMNHGAGQPLGMDVFDQDLTFDESLLDGTTLQNLPFTPSYDFETFSTTFEDPFSYSSRSFEPTPSHHDVLQEEASPQELDNKLLGFSALISNATVVDEAGQFAELNITAELYGMFFVAEDVFGGETTGRPLELTCYRRNLWQCSGQITLPRMVTNIVNDQGHHIQIFELMASISAVESIEGKNTEIISIPWKSAAAQGSEDAKVATAPPNITLDLATGQELDANRVSLPISWKRLQFKHATANNGRRKGLQQHYVVQINLLGKTKSGELIKIAEIQSGPVIVRGRSPRNFDSKKDVPLTGDKRMERKNTASSSDSTLKAERDTLQAYMQRYQALGNAQPNEWATPQPIPQAGHSPHIAKKMAISPSLPRPPVPAWSKETSSAKSSTGQAQRNAASRQSTSLPINLSLSEDERSPNRSSAEVQSPQQGGKGTAAVPNAANSPTDEADPLYEYFPLSVDDWMPPVDAVYRPHVVHHTLVPPEMKAQQIRNKSKRYFAPE
ncbi:Fc.00g039240.m01.CDS01 [Cosmosporella sp. VM-42]